MTCRFVRSLCSSSLIFAEREGVVQLGLLPFYHIYAVMATFITSLSWGQTSVIVPGFDPRVFLEVVPKYKVGCQLMIAQKFINFYFCDCWVFCNDKCSAVSIFICSVVLILYTR